MKRIILPETEIIQLYKNNVSVKKISEKYGCSVNPIRKILKSCDILLPYFLSKYNYSIGHELLNYDTFHRIYVNSTSIKEVSNHFSIGIDLTRTLVKYHNIGEINTTKRKRLNTGIVLNEAEIIRQYVKRMATTQFLYSIYKSTRDTIINILKHNNIKLRTSQESILSNHANHAYSDYDFCLKMKNKSKSRSEFVELLSCSSDTAIKILETHSIPKFTQSDTKSNNYNEEFSTNFDKFTIINSSNTPNMQIRHDTCMTEFIVQKQTILRYSKYPNRLCPKCSPRLKSSLAEHEISEYVKSLIPDVTIIRNSKGVIPPLELDIYIPDLKISIEYCGLYWHSDIYKDNKYHYNKFKQCEDKGIRLITIFEDEWLHKCEIVKNKIRHILHKSSDRIYARKCTISELSYSESKDFITSNHIQGMDNAKYYIGLIHDDNVVAIMSFKKLNASRGKFKKENNMIEISRYCTTSNVVGGFSKILKYYINNISYKHKITKILSYCDLRWGDGNVYSVTGFNLEKNTIPNYWYVERNRRVHRYNYTKHKLAERYPSMQHMTEKEIMASFGVLRIYDCGSRLFSMDLKDNDKNIN